MRHFLFLLMVVFLPLNAEEEEEVDGISPSSSEQIAALTQEDSYLIGGLIRVHGKNWGG